MRHGGISRKQAEASPAKVMLCEGSRINTKKELIKRLTHIQHLAKQKNYAEIERLLHERYV